MCPMGLELEFFCMYDESVNHHTECVNALKLQLATTLLSNLIINQ